MASADEHATLIQVPPPESTSDDGESHGGLRKSPVLWFTSLWPAVRSPTPGPERAFIEELGLALFRSGCPTDIIEDRECACVAAAS